VAAIVVVNFRGMGEDETSRGISMRRRVLTTPIFDLSMDINIIQMLLIKTLYFVMNSNVLT